MATRVELSSVKVLDDHPAPFDAPIHLNVVLQVYETPPMEPIEITFTWSPVWDFSVDQELDTLVVGPLAHPGKHEFTLVSDPPNFAEIPDPTGPTALLVAFCYKGEQFLHLGFNCIIRCKGEIPEEYTSAAQLERIIERCFPKRTSIEWDARAAVEATPVEEDRHSSTQTLHAHQRDTKDAPAAADGTVPDQSTKGYAPEHRRKATRATVVAPDGASADQRDLKRPRADSHPDAHGNYGGPLTS